MVRRLTEQWVGRWTVSMLDSSTFVRDAGSQLMLGEERQDAAVLCPAVSALGHDTGSCLHLGLSRPGTAGHQLCLFIWVLRYNTQAQRAMAWSCSDV